MRRAVQEHIEYLRSQDSQMSALPQPLVPEVSVCSPPKVEAAKKKILTSNGGRAMNNKLDKTNQRPNIRAPLSCKTKTEKDIALLSGKLDCQQDQIADLKKMIQQLLSLKDEQQQSDQNGLTVVGEQHLSRQCQVDNACPHCGKFANEPLANVQVPTASKPGASKTTKSPEQATNHCQVSSSERLFVNEMIKVANNWLKDDNLDDIDTCSQDSEREQLVSRSIDQIHPEPQLDVLDNFSTIFQNADQATSLSLHVNALAARYLQQIPQQELGPTCAPRPNKGRPDFTVTRRQQVLTEEFSINNYNGNANPYVQHRANRQLDGQYRNFNQPHCQGNYSKHRNDNALCPCAPSNQALTNLQRNRRKK